MAVTLSGATTTVDFVVSSLPPLCIDDGSSAYAGRFILPYHVTADWRRVHPDRWLPTSVRMTGWVTKADRLTPTKSVTSRQLLERSGRADWLWNPHVPDEVISTVVNNAPGQLGHLLQEV